MAGVAKLKGWLQPYSYYMKNLFAALSNHKEGEMVERWKKNKLWSETLISALTEISTSISQLHESMDSSTINRVQVEFLSSSNE